MVHCLPNLNNLNRIVLFSSRVLASKHLLVDSSYFKRFLLKIESEGQIVESKVCETGFIDYQSLNCYNQENSRRFVMNKTINGLFNFYECEYGTPAAILILLEVDDYILDLKNYQLFADKLLNFTNNLQKFILK